MVNGSSNNTIVGNYVGLDATGTINRGNGSAGISITGTSNNNTIGGTTAQSRNVIAGNSGDGISATGGSNNVVLETTLA